MDELGKTELEILNSFKDFSRVFEKIKNRPEFAGYHKGNLTLPAYDGEKLQEVSVGAGVLLGSLGGAALGTAGGFAAAGATTAAVMAVGTASTGTAIIGLSGAALTNATLAALGGGAIAAGGGGIALGTTILGATTLGAGILVGGVIFGLVGNSISSKADEAWSQMKEAGEKIHKICHYLENLRLLAERYSTALHKVDNVYRTEFESMKTRVDVFGQVNYSEYNAEQRKNVENTVLLVQLLYRMCQVNLVIENESADGINQLNGDTVNQSIDNSQRLLLDRAFIPDEAKEPETKMGASVEEDNRCVLNVEYVRGKRENGIWSLKAKVENQPVLKDDRFVITVNGISEGQIVTITEISEYPLYHACKIALPGHSCSFEVESDADLEALFEYCCEKGCSSEVESDVDLVALLKHFCEEERSLRLVKECSLRLVKLR